jgi:hypothetical protein
MRNRPTVALLIAGTFLASLLSAQRPRGPEILVSSTAGEAWPQVAMAANGDFVVTWQAGLESRGQIPKVWYRLFRADGTPKGKPQRVSNGRSSEKYAKLAVGADGSFVIVWEGGPFEDSSVFGRRFNANGSPRGGRFRLNSNTAGIQYAPAVALAPDGGFVVAWTSQPFYYSDEISDVYARRFDAAGQPLGPDFLVNTTTSDEQNSPQVAVDASGSFVIGWVSWNGEGEFFDIMARRFARDGTPQDDEFQVNSGENTGTSQYEFALGMAADGAFVILWTDASDFQNFPNGFFAQRFTVSGEPIGEPFQVNASPLTIRRDPAIAVAADGSFFAAWSSYASGPRPPGPPSYSIVGRRFASDGTPRGGELRIDLSSAGKAVFPAVALGSDGRGVVVWRQFDIGGIFARLLVP